MIEYKITDNAKILFVGINPHPGSDSRQVPFSNNKMFWYLLSRAGLVEEPESELKTDEGLKRMYDTTFAKKYGLNFVNLIDRPSVDVSMLKKGEEKPGVERALRIIRKHRPRIVCFIGKVTFQTFYGVKQCEFGWQEDIGESRAYLMRFPIRGPAIDRIRDLKKVKKASEEGTVS